MSKKPYIIQEGSNNLVIVPTEKYEPTPKKVKKDNYDLVEKVPVQVQSESVINNVRNQLRYGASIRNNNVLIDVSTIKRQNSWATNFLQSIGETPNKPQRLYHSLGTKPALNQPKENAITNNCPPLISNHQSNNKKVPESKASAVIVHSSTEQFQVKKDAHLPDDKIHCAKSEVLQLNTKVVDIKPKKYQNINSKDTVHLKTAQLKTKEKLTSRKDKVNPPAQISDNHKTNERISDIKLTLIKTDKKAYTSEAPCKANKDTKLKPTKGIVKSKIKKETCRVISDKPYLKKENIVLNTNKNCEKNPPEFENVKIGHKDFKTIYNEVSPQKVYIKSKSPIKSVVKKINNYHSEDSKINNTRYHKKSTISPIKFEEKMSFNETDADLRSKLKRKNYYHKDDEIRENRILDNNNSTSLKSKRFVPEENLIISFNAESENGEEQKIKEKTPVKTKKQQTGGNKCKKIKLEINIILKHGDTTDDESMQSEEYETGDQSTHENTDVSFLDDINVDEIVESLDDLKNNTPNINTVIISDKENLNSSISKIDVKESIYVDDFAIDKRTAITKNDTLNADIKQSSEYSLHDNSIEKPNHAVQSSTHSHERVASLNDFIKIEGNMTSTVNDFQIKRENIVKEEVSENPSKLDAILEKAAVANQFTKIKTSTDFIHLKKKGENLSDSVETVYPNDSNTIKKNYSNSEMTQESVQKHHENKNSLIDLTNQARDKVELLDMKTNDSLNANKINDGIEAVILINESDTHVEDQLKLVENETIDLTDREDNIPQKEVDDDVIIVDNKDYCMMKVETESILILDTDEDKVLISKSDVKENQNNTNAINDTVLDSSGGRSNQNNTNDESKENKLVEKCIATDKNNSSELDENNLVVIYNDTPDRVKSNTSEMKNNKKTEHAKVQSINTKNEKDGVKVLNKDQSKSNSTKSVTKDNEHQDKGNNNSLLNDTLAQRVEARMESYLGEKYKLTGLIHRGRFSTLYTYEDKKGCKNTIKVLKKKCDKMDAGLKKENMLMELQKGVPEHNLNFVRLLYAFAMSGQWCFLMEYYPKNLREVLDNQKRSFHIDVVQRLGAQLVSAVTILRNNNIIHSDIKPSHILLSDDERKLKLCGFDRAFYYDNSLLLPNVGTVNYRAPELIMGYPADYGIDVWSTALVMYEMATRRMLFPGIYNNDILYKQLCTLDDIPFEMHLHSRFRHHHFSADAFSRIIGPKGKSHSLIYKFYKKERINNVLFHVYSKEWSKQRSRSEKTEDRAKLSVFSKLLNQMLIMYPKQRIAIEFVFANPFMYDAFDV